MSSGPVARPVLFSESQQTGGAQKEHQPQGHSMTQALLSFSLGHASVSPLTQGDDAQEGASPSTLHRALAFLCTVPRTSHPVAFPHLHPPTPSTMAGYIHEVHHAAAGLQAETLGSQVFVCKKNQFQHPSPADSWAWPEAEAPGGMGSGVMVPGSWHFKSSRISV